MLLAKPLRETHWEPTIGDPTVIGWVTVACYLIAAVCCFACVLRRSGSIDTRPTRQLSVFWLALSLGMLLLAVNKQLDLQAWVYATGRNMAIRQGWFDRRHEVIRWVLIAVGALGLLSVTVLIWIVRGNWSRVAWSVYGLALLAGFAVLRTAELLEIEQLTRVRLVGTVHLSNLIELGAIALITAGAWRYNRARKTHGLSASRRPA